MKVVLEHLYLAVKIGSDATSKLTLLDMLVFVTVAILNEMCESNQNLDAGKCAYETKHAKIITCSHP